MASRIAMTILLTSCLLLPRSLSAQEDPAAGRQPPLAASEIERLERRIEELEKTKAAQEDATRAIIRDAMERSGSKINNVAAFGGVLEVLGGRSTDFTGVSERVMRLNTLECQFEAQVKDWTLANFVLQYVDGLDVLLPTTDGRPVGISRIDLDTAILTIGDTQRFAPFGTIGRMILPFGMSTGDPVADVLTLEDPLTVEAFEMREDGILFGVGLPTPPSTPRPPITSPPPVRPRVINPLFSTISRGLGYRPPAVVLAPPSLMMPASPTPLLSAGVLFFKGSTFDVTRIKGWSPEQHFGATVGYRTTGPRSFDISVDYNSSIFDSRFLEGEYQEFLDQIGLVPAMAASLRAKLGPVAFVSEWNGAIEDARFTDDLDKTFAIRPSAWQVALGYQFDWNDGVEAIGAQGTYLTVGYSRSRDLAGATQVVDGEEIRVGSVPKRRFLVGAGEWIMDGLRVAVEYSHVVDYAPKDGGTGRSASAVFSVLTYDW